MQREVGHLALESRVVEREHADRDLEALEGQQFRVQGSDQILPAYGRADKRGHRQQEWLAEDEVEVFHFGFEVDGANALGRGPDGFEEVLDVAVAGRGRWGLKGEHGGRNHEGEFVHGVEVGGGFAVDEFVDEEEGETGWVVT